MLALSWKQRRGEREKGGESRRNQAKEISRREKKTEERNGNERRNEGEEEKRNKGVQERGRRERRENKGVLVLYNPRGNTDAAGALARAIADIGCLRTNSDANDASPA